MREDRTLAAEKAMFDILKGYGNGSGVEWSDIEATVIAFNKTEENEKSMNIKKTILQDALNKMLADIDIYPTDLPTSVMDFSDLRYAYNRVKAESNRNDYLGGLSETDYPGTCLPEGTRCTAY